MRFTIHLNLSTLKSLILRVSNSCGSLCVNHHLLQEKVSMMRAEGQSHIWAQKYEFRGKFITMSI